MCASTFVSPHEGLFVYELCVLGYSGQDGHPIPLCFQNSSIQEADPTPLHSRTLSQHLLYILKRAVSLWSLAENAFFLFAGAAFVRLVSRLFRMFTCVLICVIKHKKTLMY